MTMVRTAGTALDPRINKKFTVGQKVRINEPGNLLDGHTGSFEYEQDRNTAWVLVDGFPITKVNTDNLIAA